jgi:GTP-dependent phosphoenolpyruvate carboxykinase
MPVHANYRARFFFWQDHGEEHMASSLQALESWVDDTAARTRPARVQWCDGSDAEYAALVEQMLAPTWRAWSI